MHWPRSASADCVEGKVGKVEGWERERLEKRKVGKGEGWERGRLGKGVSGRGVGAGGGGGIDLGLGALNKS